MVITSFRQLCQSWPIFFYSAAELKMKSLIWKRSSTEALFLAHNRRFYLLVTKKQVFDQVGKTNDSCWRQKRELDGCYVIRVIKILSCYVSSWMEDFRKGTEDGKFQLEFSNLSSFLVHWSERMSNPIERHPLWQGKKLKTNTLNDPACHGDRETI